MEYDVWSELLAPEYHEKLNIGVANLIRKIYNLNQNSRKKHLRSGELRKFLSKYGLWSLYHAEKKYANAPRNANDNEHDNPIPEVPNVPRDIRKRKSQMVHLLESMNDCVVHASDFLSNIVADTIDRNPESTSKIMTKLKAIHVRDFNLQCRQWKNDANRQRTEALMHKAHNFSQRKSLNARKAVS